MNESWGCRISKGRVGGNNPIERNISRICMLILSVRTCCRDGNQCHSLWHHAIYLTLVSRPFKVVVRSPAQKTFDTSDSGSVRSDLELYPICPSVEGINRRILYHELIVPVDMGSVEWVSCPRMECW